MLLYQVLIPICIFAGLGLMAGLLLSIFSKLFAIKTDEKTEQIREILPGLNCGVCGYSGCDSYAAALATNSAKTNKCIPGGDETSAKISNILGTDYQDVIETIAFVKCDGLVPHATADSYIYQGEKSCRACNLYYQGKGHCDFGCIGYGDCIAECGYGAITIVDEVATINPYLCKGCAKCVARCPKKLIAVRDATKKVFVKCSSCNTGKLTNAKCKKGCIGCGKCVKACPNNAIVLENNIANINYDKCTNCLQCFENCPKKCIEVI